MAKLGERATNVRVFLNGLCHLAAARLFFLQSGTIDAKRITSDYIKRCNPVSEEKKNA